jgi:S1-C subfamily serine protease
MARKAKGTPVLVHLTGPHRGTRQNLAADAFTIGTGEDSYVHFRPSEAPRVGSLHASVDRTSRGFIVVAAPGHDVFINGRRLEDARLLEAGDVIEIGEGGPVLRFRLGSMTPGGKTMRQAVRDCFDTAQYNSNTLAGRAGTFFATLPVELLGRTRLRARVGVLVLLTLLVGATGLLAGYAYRLDRRIDAEGRRVAELEATLHEMPADMFAEPASETDLADLESVLTERIEVLEARSAATRTVVSAAAGSVVFLQGAYALVDPTAELPLRLVLLEGGRPRLGPNGMPLTSPFGNGPIFEAQYTGSGFLATDDGLLVTNRHVVRPWEFDTAMGLFVANGFRPDLRLIAYVPGQVEPYPVEVEAVSETSDLAILRSPEILAVAVPLEIGDRSPAPGEEIVVLGYPTGLNALLARSGQAFVDSVRSSDADFWSVARTLSEKGLVRPLATQGIVGQVSRTSVVFDAETTGGGSGGPVLSLDGEVVAVTVAVLAEFGGSNLGVPIEQVRALLSQIRPRDNLDPVPEPIP